MLLAWLYYPKKKSHHNVRRPPENVERQSKLSEFTIRPKIISDVIKTFIESFYYPDRLNLKK